MKNINNILIMLISFLVTILAVWWFIKGNQIDEQVTEHKEHTEVASEQPKQVKLAKDEVLKINDNTFTKKDIEFLRLIQKAQIDVAAKNDKSDDQSFYKEKLKEQDSENYQLQNKVELEAIALLGKEKGYEINKQDLQKETKKFKDKYSKSEYYKKAEALFDDSKFEQSLEKYTHDKMMRIRVIEEIKKIKKADNPKLAGKELDFEVRQYFDDLYKDTVNDLSIATNYK